MTRWNIPELHRCLPVLLRRIELEREDMTGADTRWGLTGEELAQEVGIHRRTYSRYLKGEHLPVSEKGIRRILAMAEVVGIDREEAEAYLPDPIERRRPA